MAAVGFLGGQQMTDKLGGMTNLDGLTITPVLSSDGLAVGSSGTTIQKVIDTTCSIVANSSVPATSTRNFDCTVTGVVSGDRVTAMLAASSSVASQYVIKGVTASTTDGYVTISLLNLTGTAATPAATNGFGSSTLIRVTR